MYRIARNFCSTIFLQEIPICENNYNREYVVSLHFNCDNLPSL